MAGTDSARRFNVRHFSKAARSFTRRFRGPIIGVSILFLVLIWVAKSGDRARIVKNIDVPFRFNVSPLKPSKISDSDLPTFDAGANAGTDAGAGAGPSKKDDEEDQNNEDAAADTNTNAQAKDDDSKGADAALTEITKSGDQAPAPGLGAMQDDNTPTDSTDDAKKVVKVVPLENDAVREKWKSAKLSVVVLFHNEYDSLKPVLDSWVKKGLVDEIDELLFFVNGGKSESYFTSQLPQVMDIPESKRRIHISTENLKLGLAITKMVELATHEFVMLLEKDWKLMEEPETTASRILDSKVIVGTGVAHIIRHRHRHNPGVPLHALIMHQGREQSIMRGQKNLMCFVHHWQKDPTKEYPGQGLMWRCGGAQNHLEEEDVFCSTGEYCQWNNNPCVFKKQWFIDEVGNRYKEEYEKEHAKYGDSSPFLDFEYYTNWRSYAWTDKNFTVAVGEGLFSHYEAEHQHFNTFWYAHYRLETDYEELRNEYLRNETKLKKLGAHYDTTGDPPPNMLERYPVDFARKFHWNEIFSHDLKKQRSEIAEVYDEFVRDYRVSEDEWKEKGKDAVKFTKTVPWRHYVTKLHFLVEKGELMVPPLQPYEMSITLVTALMDIGRSELDANDGGYKFRREFKMYLDKMQEWMKHDYKKLIYTTKEIADELMKTMDDKAKDTTRFVITAREELATRWLGSDNYQKVQDIRQSKKWLDRAGWLANSPQAKLADYNPLVMSKMFFMRDAARTNPWNTTHFVFLDAKHNCMIPDVMSPKTDHILRAHMFGKFLVTYFDYTPADEIHGFEYSAMNEMLNYRDKEERQMIKVGRGGIFGGSAYGIEYITAMYDVVLTSTLRDGLMGTEENIFSILMAQVPQYFDPFSNNWACFRKIEKDHKCTDRKDQGYNCEIFNWIKNNV